MCTHSIDVQLLLIVTSVEGAYKITSMQAACHLMQPTRQLYNAALAIQGPASTFIAVADQIPSSCWFAMLCTCIKQ